MSEEIDFIVNAKFSWQAWLEENRWRLLLGIVGLLLLGLGMKFLDPPKPDYGVEIVPSDKNKVSSQKLMVDVGGAVNRPGVYQMEQGARVEEAIMSAGGLSDRANKVWVEQVLNRAEKVKDGQKIYILSTNEDKPVSNSEPIRGLDLQQGQISGVTVVGTVSVNSASQAELESLWGIGPVIAQAIISGRPYGSLDELLEKGILKSNVWEKNRDKLSL